MHGSIIKKVLVSLVAGFLMSASVYADGGFSEACTNAWMKKINDSANKVDFKNFGEKYCTCASAQPLSSKEEIQKAMQLCMSRTLLHDTMDSVEEDVGLSEAKDTDVMTACMGRWDLIYPSQNDEGKKFTKAFCECAQPKLMDLVKKSEQMTDKEYDAGIDTVAASCSGNVQEEAPPAGSTSK